MLHDDACMRTCTQGMPLDAVVGLITGDRFKSQEFLMKMAYSVTLVCSVMQDKHMHALRVHTK